MTSETLTQFRLHELSAWTAYETLAKSGQRHDADLMASVRLRWEQASAFMERAIEQALTVANPPPLELENTPKHVYDTEPSDRSS